MTPLYTLVIICTAYCINAESVVVPNLTRADCIEVLTRHQKSVEGLNLSTRWIRYCAQQGKETPLRVEQ
jgi:hypothetical protein